MTAPTVPVDLVARRAMRDLATIDHLLDLLRRVEAGYVLTNREDQALLLVPDDLLVEIRRHVGTAPDKPEELA